MQARENIVSQAGESVANALIPQKTDKQKWWQQITEYSLIVIFVVMFVTMSMTVDHFFSIENMLGLTNGALRGILGRSLASLRKQLRPALASAD